MSLASALKSWLAKDMTAGDVHVSSAGGDEPKKPKRKKKGGGTETIAVADFQSSAKVTKVDETLGLVFGWAIICKQDGADYFDLQGDHIPEDSMTKAAVDFMQSSGVAKEMHRGGPKGAVVFAFPMTADVAKAFGIETQTSGLMIAMKPSSPDMLAKFKDGTYTGFSIGGSRIEDEEV